MLGSLTCTVTATASDAVPTTSLASASVVPNAGPASATGVPSATVNTAHAQAYPSYASYCNYTNQSATGLSTPATISYYNTAGVLTTGTSKSTITCTSSPCDTPRSGSVGGAAPSSSQAVRSTSNLAWSISMRDSASQSCTLD